MHRRLRNSLRLQLVLLIGGLAMASAVAYVLLTTHLAQTQIETDLFRLQRLLATRMAAQLAHDMDDRVSELRFLASMDRLRDPSRPAQDKQAILLSKQDAYPIYAWLGIADTQGRIVASTEPRIEGADVSRRAWFQKGRLGLHREDVHEAVLLGTLLPRPEHDELPLRLIDVSLPLQDPQGRVIGVLAAHLSLDWAYRLRAQLQGHMNDQPMDILVLNREGEVIIGSPSLPARSARLAALPVLKAARDGVVSTSVDPWPDGRRYLSTAAVADSGPDSLGWTVLVRMDEDRAFADARHLGLQTLVSGLGATLAFSAIIWWAIGRKLRPLEQLSYSASRLDVQGPLRPLAEVQGDDEVAVFTRSMARLINALGKSRERFEHLLSHAPVAMAFATPQGDISFINARFTELLGYGPQHLAHVDQWFLRAFDEGPERDHARQRWQQALQCIGPQPVPLTTSEAHVRCLDGSLRIVETSGIALPDGLLVSLHDMTERRQAEAGLRLWAEAFEHAEVGVLIVDARHERILAANPAFSRQRGYAPAQMTGMPLSDLFPAERRADLLAVQRQLQQQDHAVFESEHITRDGQTFPVLVDVTLMRDSQGQAVRRMAYVQDLSERDRAAKEILRLNAELEQRVLDRTAELSAANRELDSFAFAVSHDLRAPLRTVKGLVQMLQTECASDLGGSGRDYLQRIDAGTRRMGELIEGLLALSRHTKKPLERHSVDLSAIAAQRLSELAAAEPSRQVAVEVEPGLVADCDPSLVQALLVNLLDNAWKYSSKVAQARIRFGTGEVAGLRGFCVSDNGAGFDMTAAARLFEPFNRLHSANEFQGTGVGLATVRRIVERHGGRIVACASPGQGATFCFTLDAQT